MNRRTFTVMTILAALVAALALPLPAQDAPPPAAGKIKTLLLTGGKIHKGVAIGDVLQPAMEKTGKFDITRVNEDLDVLVADKIAPYDLVVFYWTMGEITEAQKRGVMNHIASGKGFVTFHSGADSFRGDPDWRAFVGGYFLTHPKYRTFQVSITENKSPITEGIDEFMIFDEQYVLEYNPKVNVLANGLWKGQTMPVMWTQDWGKGRVFYSALGHDPKACEQEMFQKLAFRGMLWAADREVKD
ncbi:MAG TPA: ThuA domain-containing protein [Phycisphaerae bacterium]|nr:ThuA domain-containing protein [Phycisphaerae bacterium]